MNKFIELTLRDERKVLINIDAIESVMTYKGVTYINCKSSHQNNDCAVQESYEEVKCLCQSEK